MSDPIQVDDINPAILYSGTWKSTVGSTRQWGGGTVHTTTETGASATITFRGTRIMMYCSLPIGSGNEIVNARFDAGPVISTTHPSSTVGASYHQVWFDSGVVADTLHTLVVSNGGGQTDTPFELDRFTIWGLIASPSSSQATTPLPPANGSPTVAVTTFSTDTPGSLLSRQALAVSSISQSSGSDISHPLLSTTSVPPSEATVTMTGLQYITTTAMEGSTTTNTPASSASSTEHSDVAPIARIVGGVIGGLVAILLFLFLLLHFIRRRRSTLDHMTLADGEKGIEAFPHASSGIMPVQPYPRSSDWWRRSFEDSNASIASLTRTSTDSTAFRLDENHPPLGGSVSATPSYPQPAPHLQRQSWIDYSPRPLTPASLSEYDS